MSLFGRKDKKTSSDYERAMICLKDAVQYLDYVRGRRRKRTISVEEAILERKIVFLLDDLRKAIKGNNLDGSEGLIKEINLSCIELWEEMEKRIKPC